MDQTKPNYNMNGLMDECISHFLDTFALLQDTPDFLPPAALDMFVRGIYKEMKRAWKRLRKCDKSFQHKLIGKKTIFRFFGQRRPMTSSDAPPKDEQTKAEPTKETLPAETSSTEVQAHAEK